jgi:hypothetical protein
VLASFPVMMVDDLGKESSLLMSPIARTIIMSLQKPKHIVFVREKYIVVEHASGTWKK